MLPTKVNFFDIYVQKSHLPEDIREDLLQKNFPARLENLLTGIMADKISHSAFIVDDALTSQLVIGFHGGIGVHL